MDNFLIAKATSVGQVRQVNEDSMTVFDSPNGQVMAVCDGMGGQAAGDVASQLAVNIIESILTDNTFDTPEEAIRRSVLAANQGVLNRTAQNPDLEGMGSTCVMIIIKNGMVHCGWVGDSRIYYIANHTIRQLSHDQSFVQEMVDRGEISQEEAAHHPQKNEITNAIGLQGMTAPSTLAVPIKPEPGSVFLLCSDGLSSMVDDARIERTVSNNSMTLQQRADCLVEMANEAGGQDNITVELVQFGSGAGASGTAYGTAGNAAPKKPGKGRLFGMIAVCVVLIATITTGAYFVIDGQEESAKRDVKTGPANQTTTEKGSSTQSSGSGKSKGEEKSAENTKSVNQPKEQSSSSKSGEKAKEITNKGSKKKEKKKEEPKEEKNEDVKTEVEKISESMSNEKYQ